MKNYLFSILFLIQCVSAEAQQGLEKIIVEKYYISNDEDEKGTDGALSSGSVTYRIFVDMLPKYRFQAVYGVPGHPMKISTTSYFYNDEVNGGATANDISNMDLNTGAVMLDSWVSVCAGSDGNFAVLKEDDSTTIVNSNQRILQNVDRKSKISLKASDGLYPASPLSIASIYGIDSLQMLFFKNNIPANEGQSFYTDNGSWASFGGSIGLDSSNRVLIAQLTTEGEFSFELNLQLGTPFGGVENYVAKDPIGEEILFPGLNYKNENVKTLSPPVGKLN
ncbi:MAG: hypothetical protein IPH33_11150 [Bacteroidetes bacterium]|nr:hypothetical protein [Bacteroidota bacterium]